MAHGARGICINFNLPRLSETLNFQFTLFISSVIRIFDKKLYGYLKEWFLENKLKKPHLTIFMARLLKLLLIIYINFPDSPSILTDIEKLLKSDDFYDLTNEFNISVSHFNSLGIKIHCKALKRCRTLCDFKRRYIILA